jgi:hypothetical protein
MPFRTRGGGKGGAKVDAASVSDSAAPPLLSPVIPPPPSPLCLPLLSSRERARDPRVDPRAGPYRPPARDPLSGPSGRASAAAAAAAAAGNYGPQARGAKLAAMLLLVAAVTADAGGGAAAAAAVAGDEWGADGGSGPVGRVPCRPGPGDRGLQVLAVAALPPPWPRRRRHGGQLPYGGSPTAPRRVDISARTHARTEWCRGARGRGGLCGRPCLRDRAARRGPGNSRRPPAGRTHPLCVRASVWFGVWVAGCVGGGRLLSS